MLVQRLIAQPRTANAATTNVDAIVELLASAGAARFSAAVAYVTDGGVDALLDKVSAPSAGAGWHQLEKRFLVGIDWCRSDPTALNRLASLASAEVRVHDGERVAVRSGCVPYLPWHPKWFAVQGSTIHGTLCGSGNLSRNGMLRGHEAGVLQIVRSPRTAAERAIQASLEDGENWFGQHWTSATPLQRILVPYEREFARRPHDSPGRNDDGSDESGRVGTSRALKPEQLAQLAGARYFWIEAGTLSRNRGAGRPGNQLMMSALMRVFFGAEARAVPKNTHVAYPVIEDSTDPSNAIRTTLRFSHNSMDVLGLPVPISPWPAQYDDRTLLFTKVARGTALHYSLTVRDAGGARQWRRTSSTQATEYRMSSGRRWGVFG